MKQKTYVILALILLLILSAGCAKEETFDWEGKIKTDFFDGDSEIEKAIAEAVTVEVEQKDEMLHVTVKAPDICDGLLEWMEQVPDEEFTETAIEQEILRLLKESKDEKNIYELDYAIEGEVGQINYSAEFTDAMSCGLNRFYAEVTQRILEEMGGNVE
mgnify:CR=1 FL=1